MAPKRKTARPPETNPYWAAADSALPRSANGTGSSGATLVFAGAVAGPLLLTALAAGMRSVLVWRLVPPGAVRVIGRVPGVVATLVGAALLVGAYRLTAGGRADGISDELRAAARLVAIANGAVLCVGIATFVLLTDATGYDAFDTADGVSRPVAELLLALVASCHLRKAGSRAAMRCGQALALAMLGAIVARWALTRWTHDDMFNPVPPAHASLVTPMNAALWLGKLFVFGALLRVRGVAPHAAPPRR